MLFAFTFDRADVSKALLDAHARGCKVSVGVDKRWTLNGKTRDQLSRLQELAAQGIDVRVLVGTAYDVEHRAAQRSTFAGVGLQHCKAIRTASETIVGSCNFTTASRASRELGVLLQLEPEEVDAQRHKWTPHSWRACRCVMRKSSRSNKDEACHRTGEDTSPCGGDSARRAAGG